MNEMAQLLMQARGDRSEVNVYDEALREVQLRAAQEKSISKADIGALVVWKRLTAQTKWAKKLMLTPDQEVRSVTQRAWDLANDETRSIPDAGQAAREVLLNVHGMGGTGALASAVLLALAPSRMAVWDRRARMTLALLGLVPVKGLTYGRYLAVVTDLAASVNSDPQQERWLPRDVDLALFAIAGDEELWARARVLAG